MGNFVKIEWSLYLANNFFCRQDTHSQDTSVQYSLITARTAHSMRLAWFKFKTKRDLQASLCPKIRFVIWCVTCLIHGCFLTRLPPWAHPLLHLPILPHNENTQCIPHISKLSQSTSCAIKNHSGVKTCSVAETRAQQLPQVMSPRNLRPSQGSKIFLEIHVNYMMYRKFLQKKITELLSPKSWRNLEKLGRLVCLIPNYQRWLLCLIADAFRRISKMEDCKKCWFHHCMRKKLGWNPMQWSCRKEVSAQYIQTDRKESLRSHSSEGQKASGKPGALFSSEQGNLIRSCVFKNANPSNLRGSLLEGIKNHLLNQARVDLAKQELHVESLNSISASVNYNDKRKSKYWHYRTHNTDLLNLDENKFHYKKNCPWKKKLSDIQIRKMREIKRALELRVDDVSVQK